MSKIYSYTSRVIVYLATKSPPKHTRELMTLFQCFPAKNLVEEQLAISPTEIMLPGQKLEQVLEELQTMLSHPWFERVWIIQEAAFGGKWS